MLRYAVLFFICLISSAHAGFMGAQVKGPGYCFNLVAVGDSITLGFGATNPFPANISTVLSTQSSNQGVGGAGWIKLGNSGVPNLTTRAAAEVDPLLSSVACSGSYTSPLLTLFAGTNDICGGGNTGAQTYTAFQTYLGARRAAGWPIAQILAMPILPRGTCTGPATEAQNYNDAIIAGASSSGYVVVRLDLDANIGCNGCQNNATYYQADNIHPTNTGLQIIANLTCLAIKITSVLCPAY